MLLEEKSKGRRISREVTQKEKTLITSIVGTVGDEAENCSWGKLNEMVIGIKDEGLEWIGMQKARGEQSLA